MIDLATAAIIAKTAADAVGAFDKIYRGFADFVSKKEPTASNLPPPDFAYMDSPGDQALVAKSRRTGENYQVVSYEELSRRLDTSDREFIETITRSMTSYQRQWSTVFEQRSMASGIEIARLDAQLDYIAKQIADCLIHILDFVQRIGLRLDDHYHMARHISKRYLEK